MKFLFQRTKWFFRSYFILLFFFLQIDSDSLYGQSFAFQHFTEKEGLPSTYLYGISQDHRGYIWLTGESGVFWYDGNDYKIPDIQKDIKDEIIRVYGSTADLVWMQDLAGRVLVYRAGKVEPISAIPAGNHYIYTQEYLHPNGDLWLASMDKVLVYQTQQDTLLELEVDNRDHNLYSKKTMGATGDGRTILLSRKGYHLFDKYTATYRPYPQGQLHTELSCSFLKEGRPYPVIDDQVYYFDLETETFQPRLQQFNDYFKAGILAAYEDSDGDIWFSTKDGLLRLYREYNGDLVMTKHLEGEVMGETLEDTEGNLWFTTEQNGVFMLSSKKVQVYSKNDFGNPIRLIRQSQSGELILGFDNNKFRVLDSTFQVIHEEKLFKQNNRMYDLAFRENGDIYFITSNGFVVFDSAYRRKKMSEYFSIKKGAFTADGKLWLATGRFFGYYEKGKNLFNALLEKRCYSLLPISNDKIWVGSIEGLFLYENGVCEKIKNPKLHYDIRDIRPFKDGNLLVATQKNGLYLYAPQQDSILRHFTTENGLSHNNCTKILVDENFIWLATKKGINRINQTDFSISLLGTDQGLPSNEINDLNKSGNDIYVATNRGLAVFDAGITLERMPPRLAITNIKISERDTTIQERYELNYAQNNIKIEFSAITFKNADQAIYEYKMDGLDEYWLQSKVNIAQYPSLPSGKYSFRVRTKTVNSDWSGDQVLNFTIAVPFWNKWWFFLLTSFVAMGSVYLIFRELGRRQRQIKDMKISQLTALRAQMNPHFVFNALNSIQEFIVDKDTRSANRYLTQFARLMRNILHVSDEKKVSLDKEIESLSFYLNLEALRFGDSFEYILEVEDQIDRRNTYLPPMLIQPFIENALKHGLMHRSGMKKLYLRFFIKEEDLVCEVEDNGVGRARSSEIRKLNPRIYPSKATRLVYERLKLFNSIFDRLLSVEVQDLKDKKGAAVGTKIILKIHSNFKELL